MSASLVRGGTRKFRRVLEAVGPGYDGVAQLWWDSLEDLAANASNPEAIEAGRQLLEDEKKFIDLPRSPLWWGEEKVII